MKKMFILKHEDKIITRYYGYKNEFFNCLYNHSKYYNLIETIYYNIDNEVLQINFHTYFSNNLIIEIDE